MSGALKICLHTLGCKLNQSETEALTRELLRKGYSITQNGAADIYILNTCTVTHIADRKSRHLIRMLRKNHREALIVVTGCCAESDPGSLKDCGASLIVGNGQKSSIPEILDSALKSSSFEETDPDAKRKSERVRSFIKIQDGCHNFCSYCIVPFVRSDVYSLDPDIVVREVKARHEEGYCEVVLTGTEIGSYSYNGTGLEELLRRILHETKIERLHLSSLQPQGITSALIDLWEDKRLCRHFHIALQSGSGPVLKRMRRIYSPEDYRTAVTSIRRRMPEAAITTDVMIGFPGESETEFEESYNFCKEMGFAAMHVFSYSARPRTLAADMPGKVNERVKKERSLRMLELAAQCAENFSKRFIGGAMEVLWESEVKPGLGVYTGLTNNYIRIYAQSGNDLAGTIRATRLTAPAVSRSVRVLRASTKGNYGELWGEVIP